MDAGGTSGAPERPGDRGEAADQEEGRLVVVGVWRLPRSWRWWLRAVMWLCAVAFIVVTLVVAA